jgi:hypothetical protein
MTRRLGFLLSRHPAKALFGSLVTEEFHEAAVFRGGVRRPVGGLRHRRFAAGRSPNLTESRVQELIHAAAQRAGLEVQTAASSAGQRGAATNDQRPQAVDLTTPPPALRPEPDIAVQSLNPQTFDFSLADSTPPSPDSDLTVSWLSTTKPSTQTISSAAGVNETGPHCGMAAFPEPSVGRGSAVSINNTGGRPRA